jgi:hypothetical protein
MMIEAKKSREGYLKGKAICSNIGERHKEWKQLWKMNLPSKIKKNCWRLALNSIPTANVLKHRNMIESDVCQMCGAEKDTWDHALLYCTMSRCVWAQLDEEITEIIASLRASDPKQWIFLCAVIWHKLKAGVFLLLAGLFGKQGGKQYMMEFSIALYLLLTWLIGC